MISIQVCFEIVPISLGHLSSFMFLTLPASFVAIINYNIANFDSNSFIDNPYYILILC